MTMQHSLFGFAPGLPIEELAAELALANQFTALGRRSDKGGLPKRDGDSGLADLRMTVKARLRVVNHQLWEQARRKVSAELGITVTNEDMMIQSARLILSTDAAGKAAGRSPVKHSPFQLIVHQDRDGTRVHTEQGDVVLEDDEAEQLARQAEVVPHAAPPDSGDARGDNLLQRFLMVGARRHLVSNKGSVLLPGGRERPGPAIVRRGALWNPSQTPSAPLATSRRRSASSAVSSGSVPLR